MEFVVLLTCIISIIVGSRANTEVYETVLLHDLNDDHDRRHLDAGLPASLEFLLRRATGDIRLSLTENKRLNHNAPMHEIAEDSDGKRKLVKKKHISLEDEKFYHDKNNGGSFSVRCVLSNSGPCRRQLFGSLHIDGKNYDISPALVDLVDQLKRSSENRGYPHFLKEVNSAHKRTSVISVEDGSRILDDVLVAPPEPAPMGDIQAKVMFAEIPTLNAVELLVVVDPFLFKRYYDVASSTETLTREEVAELNIRRDYSLVVNAVSLRYESIEDPELQIFCIVAGFLIIRERGGSFNLPETFNYHPKGGWPYTAGGNYLGDLKVWFNSLSNPPAADAVMVFTGADLSSTDESGEVSYGVAGIAYGSSVCWSSKVSLNEAFGSFFTTAVIAAHELGHNLGSPHDGEGLSHACAKANNYIMSYLSAFYESSAYKINPWRFSRCSIAAMKKYVNGLGSNNCMLDQADPYDQAEYQEHLSKLPGERHDLDAQCKLIQGKDSKLCENTDMSNICLVMKCLAPDGSCKTYTAARGTACGSDKWCIDGACVPKVSVPPETTCDDRGHADFSCTTLRNGYYTMFDFCHTWNTSCCTTCKKLMGCWDGTNAQAYSGFVSWTKNGRTCQSWSAQEPHTHTYNTDAQFPLDGTVAGAENNCRDPGNDGKLWCYTTNKDIRWEYCDVSICDVDCYRGSASQQYKGTVSKIADGTQCQAWSEQTPHTHTYTDPAKFPVDQSLRAANNYCRDPSNDGRPWCYTVNKNKRWDWCPVLRFPPETTCDDRGHADFSCTTLRNGYYTMFDFCHTWNTSCCTTCKKLMGCWDGTNAQAYSGFVSWTKNGRTCQSWSAQEPHTHTYNTDAQFPLDGTVAGAENNCRDPGNDGKLWCYTTNKDIRWEYCDVSICDVDCYRGSASQQYKGTVSKIADGTQCQAWSEQTPHTHTYTDPAKFPVDQSLRAANNYCRDPSNDGRPWCYTVNKNKRWDWCPVLRCD